MPLDIRESKSG